MDGRRAREVSGRLHSGPAGTATGIAARRRLRWDGGYATKALGLALGGPAGL
jgi:hypothetical protein